MLRVLSTELPPSNGPVAAGWIRRDGPGARQIAGRDTWPMTGGFRASFWALALCAGIAACSGGESADPDTGASADSNVGADGEDSASGEVADNDAGGDTGQEADADTGSTDDDGSTGDVNDGGTELQPGSFGAPCTENNDCEQNHCIETPEGKICTTTCITECPGAGYKCVNTGGADGIALCVPALGNLCNPCNSNGECKVTGHGDSACVSHGDAGAFCGIACQKDEQCPGGYSCDELEDVAGNTVKQCVVTTGVCGCSAAAMKKALSTTCYNTVGDAKCAGTRTCLGDGKPGAPAGGGLSACVAAKPEAEVCDGKDNDCDAETDEATCDDSEQCTADECDAKTGCKNVNKPGVCDADGSACTQGDTCKDGGCVAGKPLECNDSNVCTTDNCEAVKGCTYTQNSGGCNADDNPCTVNDTCKEGKCEKGAQKPCSADSPCVTGLCKISSAGECTYTVTEGFTCNDGNVCTSDTKCVGEACVGKPVSCDDLNACSTDSCDPVKGCMHAPMSGPCEDGNACTQLDTCAGEVCKGSPVDVAVKCGDGNPCTSDACDPKTGCQNKPIEGDPCEDGNTCTVSDACVKGTCFAGPNKCKCSQTSDCAASEDSNACNGTLICDKSASIWECKIDPNTVVVCDTSKDGACKVTACVVSSGDCKTTPKADGTPCDADGSVCTKADGCAAGTCTPGTADPCDDKNPCTTDSCNPKTGCDQTQNQGQCDADGSACTVDDACKLGSCVAGSAKVCDDGNPCTKDSCDAASGSCKAENLQAGCDDGNGCTQNDVCGAGQSGKWACQGGIAKECNDQLGCTVDSCEPKTGGCVHTSAIGKEVDCYSGDPKTKGVGICKSGKQTCKLDGSLTACSGEVVPASKEVCGNGGDDTCNGVVDEGCAPTGIVGKMTTSAVTGKVGQLELRGSVGASIAAGKAENQGGKVWLQAGFVAWLQALLGGQ